MPHLFRRAIALAIAALSMSHLASPAAAVTTEEPRWLPKRHAGAPLEDEAAPPPSGWRLGPTLTFPYSMGLGLAYLWPGEPVTYKVGASWGIFGDAGTIGFNFRDYRVYGALVYDLVPGVWGGPYVETGLGLARSSGAILGVDWPVQPHLGFGTIGRLGETLAWDFTFSAAANGLMSMEAGVLF